MEIGRVGRACQTQFPTADETAVTLTLAMGARSIIVPLRYDKDTTTTQEVAWYSLHFL